MYLFKDGLSQSTCNLQLTNVSFYKNKFMKRFTLALCATALLFYGCNNDDKTGDEKSDSASAKNGGDTSITADVPPMDSATMMKAWMAYMTPGEPQGMLAKSTGMWNQEVTMWMDPSKPPSKSAGTSENKMILGGRYMQSVNKGSFEGMPFEGISTLGFDNARKVYQSSWVDNMGTGIMNLEGTWDDAAKTINFKGKATDPATGKEMDVREVYKIIDDNTQHMEMYCMQGGKEMKTMEIHFTRKK